MGYIHKQKRESKLSKVSQLWVWLGYDPLITHGNKVAVLKPAYELQQDPVETVTTVTTVQIVEAKFPFMRWWNVQKAALSNTFEEVLKAREEGKRASSTGSSTPLNTTGSKRAAPEPSIENDEQPKKRKKSPEEVKKYLQDYYHTHKLRLKKTRDEKARIAFEEKKKGSSSSSKASSKPKPKPSARGRGPSTAAAPRVMKPKKRGHYVGIYHAKGTADDEHIHAELEKELETSEDLLDWLSTLDLDEVLRMESELGDGSDMEDCALKQHYIIKLTEAEEEQVLRAMNLVVNTSCPGCGRDLDIHNIDEEAAGCEICKIIDDPTEVELCAGATTCRDKGKHPCKRPHCHGKLCEFHVIDSAGICEPCREHDEEANEDWEQVSLHTESTDGKEVISPEEQQTTNGDEIDDISPIAPASTAGYPDMTPVQLNFSIDGEPHPPMLAAMGGHSTTRVYAAIMREEPTERVLDDILGRQRAFVTKNISTKKAILTEGGRVAAVDELRKVFGNYSFALPVALQSLSEDDVVYRLHLMMSVKHVELSLAEQKDKGRLIALGHMLLNKVLRLRKDLHRNDYWVPTSSLEDVRMVETRATASRRQCETIDLLVAYMQVRLKATRKFYGMIEPEVVELLKEASPKHYDMHQKIAKQGMIPAYETLMGVYGLGPSGHGFVTNYIGWLVLNGWDKIPESPALLTNWHDASIEEMLKLARENLEWVKAEERMGRYPLDVTPADMEEENQNWAGVLKRLDTQQGLFEDRRRACNSADQCSVFSLYIDDSLMEAAQHFMRDNWTVIQLMYKTGAAYVAALHLGMYPRLEVETEDEYVTSLDQTEYVRKVTNDYEKARGKKLREWAAPGQDTDPPMLESLEREKCPKFVRTGLGGQHYTNRGTRLDSAMGSARLARFVDRWCEWSQDEMDHLMGYMKGTWWWKLYIVNRGDGIEEWYFVLYSDAGLSLPRTFVGRLVTLQGERGGFSATGWRSGLLGCRVTNTGEAELGGWAKTIKDGLRAASIWERWITTLVRVYADNESLRYAVSRGYSEKLVGMRRQSGLCLLYLQGSGVLPRHIQGIDKLADILTKILSRKRMLHLVGHIYGLTREGRKIHAAQILHHIDYCDFAWEATSGDYVGIRARCMCLLVEEPQSLKLPKHMKKDEKRKQGELAKAAAALRGASGTIPPGPPVGQGGVVNPESDQGWDEDSVLVNHYKDCGRPHCQCVEVAREERRERDRRRQEAQANLAGLTANQVMFCPPVCECGG